MKEFSTSWIQPTPARMRMPASIGASWNERSQLMSFFTASRARAL